MPRNDLPPLTWEGFYDPNYTPVPDDFFDILLPYLSDAELRVLLYLIRRTYGFKKREDAVSLAQIVHGIVKRDGERLDHGAGISKAGAVKAIKGLVEKGVILTQRNRSAERGDEATTYILRMRGPLSTRQTGGVHQVDTARLRSGLAPVHQVAPQETVVQNTENKREDREVSLSEDVDAPPPAPPPYSPVIAGAVLDLARTLRDDLAGPGAVQVALRLWQQSGWSEAQFVAALQAARGKQRRLSGVLEALARQVQDTGEAG